MAKIIIAKHAGFCFGVKRAVEMAGEALRKNKKKVYCLGEIIHNPDVVSDLENKGLRIVTDTRGIKEKESLVIRSHGVSPDVILKAKKKKIRVIDATCPFVKKAQKTAIDFQKNGRQVVIFGDPKHSEVIGIKGGAKNAIVIQNEKEAKNLKFFPKIGLLAQTTQKPDIFQRIVVELFLHTNKLCVTNTICLDSFNKKEEVKKISKLVDVMIVVGGKKSNNTKKLAEVSKEQGTETHHIENASQLKNTWIKNVKKIGIVAGASTPDKSIKQVVEKIKSFE